MTDLRVDLARAHVPRAQRQALAVLHLPVLHQALQRHGLDVVVLRPHQLPRVSIQRRHGLLVAQFQHHAALVVADRELVGVARGREAPRAFQPVVEGRFRAVGGAVPQSHRAVLGGGDDQRQPRVEAHGRHVVRVPLERLQTRLRLVVPHLCEDKSNRWGSGYYGPYGLTMAVSGRDCTHLHRAVVGAGQQVGFVAAGVVIQAIDAAFVAFEREMRRPRRQTPHLHSDEAA